jgi:hypothetical protein
MAGEELPDLVVSGRIERLVVAPPDLGELILGEAGLGYATREICLDEVGEPVLIGRGEGGAGLVDEGGKTGVHGSEDRQQAGGEQAIG